LEESSEVEEKRANRDLALACEITERRYLKLAAYEPTRASL
jgi:hypothetical protein